MSKNPRIDWLIDAINNYHSDECLIWPFTVDRDGYGRVKLRGRESRSHRMIFFLTYGRWPNPCALHSCDTPRCCNLRHISEGTHARNQHEKAERGRSLRGELQHDAKLTPDLVTKARTDYATGKLGFESLSRKYGVTTQALRWAITGKTWKHVPGAVNSRHGPREKLDACKRGHPFAEGSYYSYKAGKVRQCKACTAIRGMSR